jgi:hypothetical protein
MGTWSFGILDDDFVSDVVGFVTEQLKAGTPLDIASKDARNRFADSISDEDEGPLFWLALAHVQWKYGALENETLEHVQSDVANGYGVSRWAEEPSDLSKRKAVLLKFLQKIETPNSKPSKPPKVVVRKAPFQKGDCLAVQLADGRYTAALVLKADNSNQELGMNLIASLDYLSVLPPELAAFKKKEWLILRHGNWNGRKDICWYLPAQFKRESKRIKVVGNINLGWLLPKESKMYTGWGHIGQQILLVYAHEDKQNA